MKERSLSTVCLRKLAIVLVLGLASALTGCTGFFVPVNSGSGSGSSGSGGGSTFPVGPNYVYVGNATAMTVDGFLINSGTNAGTLSQLPGMPFNVGVSPSALVVHPSDKFLYVVGAGGPTGQSAIYCYPINSDGSLGASTNSAGVAVITTQAVDISPDGNWLLALDSFGSAVDVYQINQTNGSLSTSPVVTAAFGVTGSGVPTAVKISPNGQLVFVSLGTAGDIVYSFNTSTGALVNTAQIPLNSSTIDHAFAVDSTNSYLYIARTGSPSSGVAVYSIGSNAAFTEVQGSPFSAGAGTQPLSVLVDASNRYVYVGNGNGNSISGFTIGLGGGLTTVAGSPFAAGTQLNAIGGDNSGSYILAAAFGGGPDLAMYSFDTTTPGKLDLVTSAQTGTDPTGASTIALTH